MEPMPMPTRRASAPQSIRCLACRFVTTLPATTCVVGYSDLIHLTISCWKTLSPWLLSMMIASTPASTSILTRSLSVGRVPMAAATMRLLVLSLVAKGNSAFFLKSVRATSATNLPSGVTTGSFPFLDSRSLALASDSSTPSGAVTSLSNLVMTPLTVVDCLSFTKSLSRFVTRPSSLDPILPSSVTGKPVKPQVSRSLSSSASGVVGGMHTGSRMKPLLYFFTFITSLACTSAGRFVWMTPMPPSSAMAMAILASVTVSMGVETMGVLRVICLVNFADSSTSCTPKLM
mmetsp:Transcript_19418/g.49742  ORF Transcript_19418/g.49742 Transcript_19418/m.49742 type:complete len:289 (+) Transcript_19418:188-1054(+)